MTSTTNARRLDLSLTQVLTGVLAAVTATVAASYLGVAGTVIGAALASAVTVIANAVFGHSLRSTQAHVREVRGLPPMPPALDAAPQLPPVEASPWLRRIALGTVSLFAVVLTLVTGFEAVAGRPLADFLRGDSGSGTTLFGDNAGTHQLVPSRATTVTVTQSVVVTTPTVTSTAPAVTETSTPTVTTTPTSTPPSSTTETPSPSSTP